MFMFMVTVLDIKTYDFFAAVHSPSGNFCQLYYNPAQTSKCRIQSEGACYRQPGYVYGKLNKNNLGIVMWY